MAVEHVENLIIGSGEGGKCIAWHLGAKGERTVVVERRWVGGSCPNVNCLPSKNEIWSARVADLVRHGARFGAIAGAPTIDMAAVRRRKREMVDGLVKVHLDKYRASGAELIMGEATFTAPRTVGVRPNDGGATRTIIGDRVFLNLGTRATIPSATGLAEAGPLTHVEMLELDRVPGHLIVIGGGYVGLEFAQAYRRFGSRVTVVQHGHQLLVGTDPDVAAEVARFLAAEGVEVLLSAEVMAVTGTSGVGVTMTVKTPAGTRTLEATDVLAAAGRTPNNTGIRPEIAGVELDARGYLKVNERLETTAANVWGVGECAGTPQFTHASYDDYRIIRDNLAGGHRTTTDRLMPSCLYTDPPVAHLGLTESEAARRGVAVRVARIPMAAVLRTRTLDETQGFMKALVDPSDRIVGFTMVGPEAGEVMAVVQMTMTAGLPFTALRDAVLAHPTMAEGLNVLFDGLAPSRPAA